MLQTLDRPMTAADIATACDLPRSTVYQKLEEMVDAGLLVKHEKRGKQTMYTVGFDEVVVEAGAGKLELSIVSRRRSASEQLSELWTEVRPDSEDSE
ncbi:helix-turn-helix domain-containing protein [Haloferax sp. YSMS24]|uniref:helix-turn-helix domain-containing protein n=1 Tax=unclassified Haloferax TaxID=2625095 RepID=UPI00398CDAAD